MFKLKSETELNFDSREMQKTYFEQTQPYPGYYHQSTPNGYGEYNGQMGYNATPPPEAHYRGNYNMHSGSQAQGSSSGNYGPLDYTIQSTYNPQCHNMNVSSPMGVTGQQLHPDPSMLKAHHPHGTQGAGHHQVAQLGMQGQEIFPWMKVGFYDFQFSSKNEKFTSILYSHSQTTPFIHICPEINTINSI